MSRHDSGVLAISGATGRQNSHFVHKIFIHSLLINDIVGVENRGEFDMYDEQKSEQKPNPLQMFSTMDMDEIQSDIERELESIPVYCPGKIYEAPPTHPLLEKTATGIEPIYFHQVQTPATITSSGFYRETIKYIPENYEKTAPPGYFKKVVAFVLVFLLTGSLGFGIGAGASFINQRQDAAATNSYDPYGATLLSVSPTFVDILDGTGVGTLADIIEAMEPSVVTITGHAEGSGFPDSRQGSGVIFAEDEQRIFIVTSRYIVQGREWVSVRIAGSDPIYAHPIGDDTTVDLSVIGIYKQQLVDAGIDMIVIATFGDSDQMRVGDTVLAIGNAMGDGNAATRGVISASDRSVTLPVTGHVVQLLQTDAAINYGNSGGPLINTRGEVIGINLNQATTFIFGMTTIEGIGYSVSSNIIAPLLDDLIHGRRPGLGIAGGNISEDIATRLGVLQLGVYVSTVVPGGAAHRGGMQDSDIITGFNGLPVLNWPQLVYAIRAAGIGQTVEVRVLRYGNTAINLYIELDAMVFDRF